MFPSIDYSQEYNRMWNSARLTASSGPWVPFHNESGGSVFHLLHHGKTSSVCAPRIYKESSFPSVLLGAREQITQRRLFFPHSRAQLTACKHKVLKQSRQTRPADVDYCSCEGWSPLGSHQPLLGLQLDSCEANCSGHIHPVLKASTKPQSQQLTAGMDVSFSTSAGELINQKKKKPKQNV